MIVGSLYVTAGALILGGPIGILTAVFMAYFCPPVLYKPLKSAINLMAGIPSVVYGFFGLVVLVPMIRQSLGGFGMGVLAASILLGMMILPTIISISESSLRAVSAAYYEGGIALGASHERSVFFAVVPAAKRGILASIVLGTGRAIGETMAVIMVAGNQAILPQSLTSGVRTLTTNIVMEMGYSSGLHRQALIGTAVVLFVFILLINISFSALQKEGKMENINQRTPKQYWESLKRDPLFLLIYHCLSSCFSECADYCLRRGLYLGQGGAAYQC